MAMDKCFLSGVSKIRRIMQGTTFCCRHCGLAYHKFLDADRCCKHNKGKRKASDGTVI